MPRARNTFIKYMPLQAKIPAPGPLEQPDWFEQNAPVAANGNPNSPRADFGFVPHTQQPSQSGDDFGFVPNSNPHADLGFVPDAPHAASGGDWFAENAPRPTLPTIGQQLYNAGKSFVGETLHNLNPINVAEGAYNLVRHPVDAFNADSQARDAEMAKSVAAFNKGDTLEGATRYLTGAVPVLGPKAGKAFDAINTGNTEEGGKAIGDITSIRTVPEIYKGVGGVGVSAPVIKGLSDWWGKATGAGGEALRTGANAVEPAAKKAYVDALRNRTSEVQIVNDLKSALNRVTADRANAYRSAVANLDQSIQTDITPAQMAYAKQMYNYNIYPNRNAPGLNFSRSTITSASDRRLVGNLKNDLQSWPDLSPNGLDALKQRVYSYAGDATPQVAPLFYRVADQLRNELESKVPGYKDLTSKYAAASDLIKQVQNELSTNNQNPGVTIRKLSNALNQNNDYRRILLEALDNAAGSHLKEQVAGNALKGAVPRGMQGVLAGSPIALGLYLHNPELLAGAALSSPRVAGEMMAAISAMKRMGVGKGLTAAGKVGGAAAKASTVNPNKQLICPQNPHIEAYEKLVS